MTFFWGGINFSEYFKYLIFADNLRMFMRIDKYCFDENFDIFKSYNSDISISKTFKIF